MLAVTTSGKVQLFNTINLDIKSEVIDNSDGYPLFSLDVSRKNKIFAVGG